MFPLLAVDEVPFSSPRGLEDVILKGVSGYVSVGDTLSVPGFVGKEYVGRGAFIV